MAQWGRLPLETDKPEALQVKVLQGARLFPGVVTTRGPETHTGGQLLLTDDFQTVPDSWCRMDGRYTLPEDVDVSVVPEEIDGDHLFLGSMQPHFGHGVLEGLARAWAFAAFSVRHPQGFGLFYEPSIPPFAWELIVRSGIPPDRVRCLDRPVRIERLHVPTPAQRSHHWFRPEMIETWQTIGRSGDQGGGACARTWLSRRTSGRRRLRNEDEIEARFAAAGFDIVAPESLSLSEQLALARRSEVLAGCVGSQMFLAAFQRPGGSTLIMAPSNFLYPDDALIAEALERKLAVAFGSPVQGSNSSVPWWIDPDAADALLATVD